MAIEQDLDLDVAGADHQALEDEPVVIEGGGGLAPGRGDGIGECLGATDRAHALAAAARRGFDQQRKADVRRRRDELVVGRVGFVEAGEDRDPERCREPAGRGLVAHDADRLGRRADPADPGRDHGLGEVGVLGEEPETGVERVRSCRGGRLDDRGDIEQVERAGALGRGHDRRGSRADRRSA